MRVKKKEDKPIISTCRKYSAFVLLLYPFDSLGEKGVIIANICAKYFSLEIVSKFSDFVTLLSCFLEVLLNYC